MSLSARKAAVCVALAVLTLATYWPLRLNGFVNYDEPSYVTEDSHVQDGLTWTGVAWAFRTTAAANWHPLTWLSHMLDCQLYGLRPWGHHLTNLLFHIANTLLLFLVLQRMTGAQWRSAWVAALFALHPLHVESVAWVAERKDVLSTFFGLLTIGAYARYAQSKARNPKSEVRRPKASKLQSSRFGVQGSRFAALHHPSSFYYCLTLLFFALGLMSKPMLVTLPCLLLLLDYWPLDRLELNTRHATRDTLLGLLPEKVPLMALSVASCVVTYLAQRHTGAVASTELVPVGSRLLNAVLAYCTYIGKALWPVHLAVFYPYRQTQSFGWAALAAVFLIIVTAGAWLWRGKWPHLLVGWLWFLGTLVPVIGLVQVGSQSMADRYTYIPLIGLLVALAWSIPGPSSQWRSARPVLAVAGALTVLLCLSLTRAQVRYWRDSESLFRHAVSVTAGNFVAHGKLGEALAARGALPEAKAEFAAALGINPAYFPAMYNLASLLRTNGEAGQALSLFRQALELRPHDAAAHYNLAIAYRDNKDYTDAITEMNTVLTLVTPGSSDYTLAQSTLADLKKNQPAEAPATGTTNLTTPQKQTTVIKPPLTLPQEATPPATNQ